MAPRVPQRAKSRRVPATRTKITGRLKTLADIKQTGGLLSEIQTHRLKKTATNDRRQDVIHPSEMAKADWCPRATYYRIRDVRAGRSLPPETFGAQLDNIFEEGHMIHAKYQGWLTDMGVLWGDWLCINCGNQERAQIIPNTCAACLAEHSFHYREIPLTAEKTHLITGHADGAVGTTMLEIKSIGVGTLRLDASQLVTAHTHKTVTGKSVLDLDGLWKAIKRPLPSHNRQGNIYLWLAQQMGLPFTTMTFLYEFKATQAVKEFTVTMSDRIITPLLDSALDIRYGLDRGRPPARAFTDRTKKPCKSCAFVDECLPTGDTTTPTRRDPDARRTRTAGTTPASGRDGAGRPRPYVIVRQPHELGGVPQCPARRGGDPREGGRGIPEARRSQGSGAPLGREDGRGGQGEDGRGPRRPGRR